MILQTKHRDYLVEYSQPDLPWYKRMIGMRYGPGWYVSVRDKYGHWINSERQYESPNPARVAAAILEVYDSHFIKAV